jgi:hypothetical protein
MRPKRSDSLTARSSRCLTPNSGQFPHGLLGFRIPDGVWGRCRQYTRIVGEIGPAVSVDAAACRLFSPMDSTSFAAKAARARGAPDDAANDLTMKER